MTEDASTDVVRVRLAGPVRVVTLDRPDKRNAINAAMTAALDAAVDRLEDESDLRVAVLEGSGAVFCAGSDLLEGPGPATPRRTRRCASPQQLDSPQLVELHGKVRGHVAVRGRRPTRLAEPVANPNGQLGLP